MVKSFANEIAGTKDEDEGEQVLGELPEPPEGMTYRLDPQPDGSVAVVLVADDGADELASVNTGDNRRGASDSKTRSVLAAMNKSNRAYHTRDSVAAATKEQVIFTHTPLLGEKLVLRENGNRWELVLVSARHGG